MKINEKIKARREELKLTVEDVARALNVNKSTISRYESESIKKMPIDFIKPLANVLKCSPEYLMGWIDEDSADMYKQSGIDFFRIPLYSPICCGDGGFNEDNVLEYVPVPSKGLSNPDNYFCQIADGNSMIDAGIDNGDLLVFEKVNRIDTGNIGCFCVDENTAMCKKYTVVNNIVMLMPMNSDYEPVIVDPLDSCFRCIGRLRKVIKDF